MISGHEEFFFLAIWWAGYFFPFFSLKLFITFVLHAIFFFLQALAGNFFQNHPPPPPQELTGRPLSRSVASIYMHKRTYARRASMYSYIELFPEK